MRENYVLAQLANVNQFDISAMLASPLISPQVINHAKQLHGKRQKQFITCRYLLAELLNDHYEISCLPLIIIGNNQRPQFEKTNLPDFNISHSGLFSFILKERLSEAQLAEFLDEFKYFSMAFSWGGFESLILANQPEDIARIRPISGVDFDGTLIRIHIGLEDVDHLIADLEAGLNRINTNKNKITALQSLV